jgi:hypothetical protein
MKSERRVLDGMFRLMIRYARIGTRIRYFDEAFFLFEVGMSILPLATRTFKINDQAFVVCLVITAIGSRMRFPNDRLNLGSLIMLQSS